MEINVDTTAHGGNYGSRHQNDKIIGTDRPRHEIAGDARTRMERRIPRDAST